MDDSLEGQGTGRAPEQRPGEGTTPETDQRAAGRQQPPQGGARRDRDRDPRRRRPGGREGQPPTQQHQQPQHSRRAEPSLNMEELHELFSMFTAQGLTEFELEKEGFRVRLRRDLALPPGTSSAGGAAASQPLSAVHPPAQVLPFVAPQVTPGPTPESAPAQDAAAEARQLAEETAEKLHTITSPIVGTFYRSPSPASDPFVRQGSRVEPDTVVCIIEAMKLMNEILAETAGTVEEVYVENGQPVEYGQALFGIRK